MISYRAFRNTDPPALAEIWRSQPQIRGQFPAMTADLFEQLVFSRPYFDRHGLIVAVEDEQPVGFVHAGQGPTADQMSLGTERGAVAALMVSHKKDLDSLGPELLRQAENYLQSRGVQTIQGGGCPPVDPFYQGLYGGSRVSGWLESDVAVRKVFLNNGYQQTRTRQILQRSLVGFRPLVDRDQMQIRRRYQVEMEPDPLADTWWEACTTAFAERVRFHLVPRAAGARRPGMASRSTGSYPVADAERATGHGRVTYWNIEPLASAWGVHASGLTRFEIDADKRRQGLATFLLGESLRNLQTQGTTLIETHIDSDDHPSAALFRKIGFTLTELSYVYEKTVGV